MAIYELKDLTLEEYGFLVAISDCPHCERTAIFSNSRRTGLSSLTKFLRGRFAGTDYRKVCAIIAELQKRNAISISSSQYGWEIEVAPRTGS